MNTLSSTFGSRLKTAREAMGLTERDAADRLHLSEKIITQLESEEISPSLPPVFIRGYLRAYANLLQIDTQELQRTLEKINDAPAIITPGTLRKFTPARSHQHLIKTFSYFTLAIWIGCTALWWYIHSNRSAAKIALTNSLTPTKSGSDAATTTISTPIAAMTPPAATTASSSSMTPEQPLKTTSVVNEEGDENSNEEG